MGFILFCYILKIILHTDKEVRFRKLWLSSTLAVSTGAIYLLRFVWANNQLYLVPYLMFYIHHFKQIRRTFLRFLKIITRVYQIILLELMLLLLTTYVLRIMTFGDEEHIKDADFFFSYNYNSFYNILVTLLYLVTVNNFPELIIGAGAEQHRAVIYTVVCIHAFVAIFMIHGVILGVINDEYGRIYQTELETDLNDRNTIAMAMGIVEDQRDVDIDVLEKLVLENIENEPLAEADQLN